MPWFESSHEERVEVETDLETTLRHFADPETIVASTEGVETAEIDGAVVHFVLKEQDHGVMKFQPSYRCRYTAEEAGVRWETLPGGNTDQSGRVRLSALPDGGTAIDFSEVVKVDLPVPQMMAPMLRPVVAAMGAKEIAGFLHRMVAALPSRGVRK